MIKGTTRARTYRAIYRLLDRVSPVPFDCGMICGAACCTAIGEEDMGIYLLPGEEKIHDRHADWLTWNTQSTEEYFFPESWHGNVHWVRCNEHEVGFFFRRFPLLYPVRQIAFAKDIYFVDFELRFLSRRVDQAKVLRTVQGQHCMIVIPGARLQQTPLPCGFHFNRPAARQSRRQSPAPGSARWAAACW